MLDLRRTSHHDYPCFRRRRAPLREAQGRPRPTLRVRGVRQVTVAAAQPLPRLLDCRTLMAELGVKRATAEAIMRQIPTVRVDGHRTIHLGEGPRRGAGAAALGAGRAHPEVADARRVQPRPDRGGRGLSAPREARVMHQPSRARVTNAFQPDGGFPRGKRGQVDEPLSQAKRLQREPHDPAVAVAGSCAREALVRHSP